ncbi:MAG: hypothetical protein Q8K30_00240 [Candidatus Gracilibacteria bacterium]|nr:hypothetical protein [Candidatus Gracilibacteria bacterium]
MKKIALLIISLLFSSIIFTGVSAAESEAKLYKDAILSTNKIKTDYINGKDLVKKIEKAFNKFRYDKDRVKAQNIQNIVKKGIDKLNTKTNLTSDERKKLNLYNNIYYRTLLLLNYQL